MGEKDFEEKGVAKMVRRVSQEMCLSTPGDRFHHVSRDENGSATALGRLAFFARIPGSNWFIHSLGGWVSTSLCWT